LPTCFAFVISTRHPSTGQAFCCKPPADEEVTGADVEVDAADPDVEALPPQEVKSTAVLRAANANPANPLRIFAGYQRGLVTSPVLSGDVIS
jgi:hypothetical protein